MSTLDNVVFGIRGTRKEEHHKDLFWTACAVVELSLLLLLYKIFDSHGLGGGLLNPQRSQSGSSFVYSVRVAHESLPVT